MCEEDLNSELGVADGIDDVDFGEAPLDEERSFVAPDPNASRRSPAFLLGLTAIVMLGAFVAIFVLPMNVLPTPTKSPNTAATSSRDEGLASSDGVSQQPDVSDELDAASTDSIDAVAEGLATAKSYWSDENYVKVVEACTEVLTIDTNNTKALYARGMAHARLQNWTDAVKDHISVKKIDPELAMKPAAAYALAYYETAREFDFDAKSYIDQGDLTSAANRLSYCIKFCRTAFELNPELSEVRTLGISANEWLNRCQVALKDSSGQSAERLKLREWRDSSGKFKINARLMKIDDRVRLEKPDGTRKSILLEQLSEEDQNWIGFQQ